MFRKIQKELVREVLNKVFICFDSQIKVMRQISYAKVDQEVRKLEKKQISEVCDDLSTILLLLVQKNL